MTPQDYVEIIGFLFGAYSVGFGSGYLIRLFHKTTELFR